MNIFEFLERFPGEDDCLNYFIETRRKSEILCRKCGCTKHVWMVDIDRFECEKCGNQIGIKTGTAMENSKLPIKYWFMAIHLFSSTYELISEIDIHQKFMDANQLDVLKMTDILKICFSHMKTEPSFDGLLTECINNYFTVYQINN